MVKVGGDRGGSGKQVVGEGQLRSKRVVSTSCVKDSDSSRNCVRYNTQRH